MSSPQFYGLSLSPDYSVACESHEVMIKPNTILFVIVPSCIYYKVTLSCTLKLTAIRSQPNTLDNGTRAPVRSTKTVSASQLAIAELI